jgi:hypothetical protein
MDKVPWYRTRTFVGGNPFASLGLDWCVRCRMEVDTDTEAHHDNDVYVYRRRCLRCGAVIKYGACYAPIINLDKPLPPKSLTWISEPGRDRR